MSCSSPLERVEIEDVGKLYGPQLALDGVSLTLRRGRPCVLMGANGAGKSSLIQIVATALAPDRGRVRYLTEHGGLAGRELRRRIGIVTHQPMAYPELTPLENVTFFARLWGLPDPREEAARMLLQLGLDPASRKPAGQLSRGMSARLSAARALVTHPELLLLDEAVSGLDREGRRTLLDLVVSLAGDAVVLMASHHAEDAARVGHHLVILSGGVVGTDEPLHDEDEAQRLARIVDLLDKAS
ncbi:MAG: ABC transporter ATP-binding protein [Polyangia bacterium]|jgi:ABC-type multidrug transport system ATPase subunit|nr:ABC transporter ATP-binding protein [Polyangia bacterium]